MTRGADAATWQHDVVRTSSGRVLPVRATARRPIWSELADEARRAIVDRAGSDVVRAGSTGTGFTPGFASRLELADGRAVFVKAASARIDERVGWSITDSYREEIRKLRALPPAVPAPRLHWSLDDDLDGVRWVILGLEAIDGRPPRRPWRPHELDLVTDALAAMAPWVATAPQGLQLASFLTEFGKVDAWSTRVIERDGTSNWLDRVIALGNESLQVCTGTALAHLDLRDDNILIDADAKVWICDWNWPVLAAPWLDLVTVLISAWGDGLDADAVLASHPLTNHLDRRAIDAWLASLWLYFTTAKEQPVPPHSPFIRDHQAWYDDVTRDWLTRRLQWG